MWAMSRIERAMWDRDKGAATILRAWAARDGNERVRERSVGALAVMRDAGGTSVFLDALAGDPSPRVRRAAAEAAGSLRIPEARAPLADLLKKDADPLVRAECARALGRAGDRRSAPALMIALLQDPSPEVRALCAEALSLLQTPDARALLSAAGLQDPSTLVRIYAVRALADTAPAASSASFKTVWETATDPDLRVEAYRGLLLSGKAGEWEAAGFADLDDRVRFLAFRNWIGRSLPSRPEQALARGSTPVSRLEEFLFDRVGGIRELAKERLEAMGYTLRASGFGYVIER